MRTESGLPARLASERMEWDWRSLTDLRPRFAGAPNNDQTIAYLVEQLEKLPHHIWRREFGYLGWRLREAARLRLVAPLEQQVGCEAFISCGPTPEEGISAELDVGPARWSR